MESILQRIASGDTAAVDDSLSEYGDLVWRVACRRLGANRADIEDSIQEVFVEIWLKARFFDPGRGSEAAFVATIAHRRLIDIQRRLSSRERAEYRAALDRPPSLRDSTPVLSSQERSELVDEFRRLPGDEADAIWLAVHRGLTHREISEATGSPIGTVKTRLRRGLARLYARIARPSEQREEVKS